MKITAIFFIFFIFNLSSFAFAGNEAEKDVLTYSGKAFTTKTGSFFYVETHNEVIVDKKHCQTEIIYSDEKGDKIGYKTLDFAKNPFSPCYKLEDNRAKYREGAEILNDKVKVYYQYTDKEKLPNAKTISVPQPIVIDGGFNYFVKKNWEQLMKGNILTFNFVSPSKMDYFTLRISKKQELVFDNKKASLVYLELDNMILRWLLSPIKIIYDNGTKRILKYEGIANLSDKNGKNETVNLVFPNLGP